MPVFAVGIRHPSSPAQLPPSARLWPFAFGCALVLVLVLVPELELVLVLAVLDAPLSRTAHPTRHL